MKIENLLRASWYTPGLGGRWGLPLILEGSPGSAKTSRINQAGHDCGLYVRAVIASIHEPTEFNGLPVYSGTGSYTYAPPEWAHDMSKRGRGVVFFDELNTAPPSVQAALLRCVLEGVVGNLTLPPGVRFIAAQNSVEDAAGGHDLAAPLANRFGHLSDVKVTVDDWAQWLMSGREDDDSPLSPHRAEETEKMVMERWPTEYARAKGYVVGFTKRKDILTKQPKSSDPAASKAWPSPRTWVMATHALAGAAIHGLSDSETSQFVGAFIGMGAETEFYAFRKANDLPDPAALLDGKIKHKFDKRIDRTQAVLAACAALVAPPKAEKRVPRAKALWDLLKPLSDGSVDLVLLSAKTMIQNDLGSRVCGANSEAVVRAIEPSMVAAGMLKEEAPE